MGIHTGEVESRGGDFFGPAVNRTARIMSAGHGGQVLLSEATAGFVEGRLPAGATLRDLGEHRLKDLGRSQRLFQLAQPGLPAEFAPLSTLDLRPNNLPTETSAFVGRDAELRAIRERLDDKDVRLVTLTGPGGSGKTRLAIRAAADQIDRFTDGVYFVELVTATDSDAVLALIATAIGLGDAAERSPLDELRRQLRAQQVLIVLDNFEQVTVAAPTLVGMLADCPGLKVLVTSRQALRVRGEHVVSVPPLSLPAAAAGASADDLSQFEAIQLFVERARGVRPDFRLTDDNAAAVAEICRRLDGLPLAIELATARLNLFSPDALRDRLAGSFKALGSGARDLPERQQTLRATIEWSYQLLTPAEQRLFELLSVFAGASVEGVEAVAADLDDAAGTELNAIDGLGSLLDKSLVRHLDAAAGGDEPRVVMLETIKAYATAQLDTRPDFAEAAREGHARYFAELARGATTETAAAELDNLRIAWANAVGRKDITRLGDAARGAVADLRVARLVSRDDPARRRSPRGPGVVTGECRRLADRADADDEPRQGDHAPPWLHGRSGGRLRRGACAREGARRTAAALPRPAQPRKLLRLSRRGRQGQSSTRRRSSSSPTPPTMRACGSPATRTSARIPGSPGSSSPGSDTSTRRSPRSRAATTCRAGCAWGWTRGCRA